MEKQGAKLLWIPYFFTRDDLQRIKEISTYFDKVILQPGTFYSINKYYKSYVNGVGYINELGDSAKWGDIFTLIANDRSGKFGVEMEFDMGLVTGRCDRPPPLTPEGKQYVFLDYINKIVPRIGEIPIGIYSGGPNEQGYNNIFRNSNLHNNQNHVPTEADFGTGSNYTDLYRGNLIYEINKILFSNRETKLKQNELAGLVSCLP